MKSNDIIMESGLFSINSLIESPEHSQLSYRTEFTFLVSCAKLSAKILNLCLGGDPNGMIYSIDPESKMPWRFEVRMGSRRSDFRKHSDKSNKPNFDFFSHCSCRASSVDVWW